MIISEKEKKDRVIEIFDILKKVYPNPKPLLKFNNPFELLIATILAAQCTDERVNKVTPGLFLRYPTPEKLMTAPIEDIEELIQSTGFYHNKAKSIKNVSTVLTEAFEGKLPESVDELVKLPGVGRKTAGVIAGTCFGAQAIIVDTHFKRVSQRLGLAEAEDADKIEKELKPIVSEKIWTIFSLVINFHGRYRCKAKKPQCPECEVKQLCPYENKTE